MEVISFTDDRTPFQFAWVDDDLLASDFEDYDPRLDTNLPAGTYVLAVGEYNNATPEDLMIAVDTTDGWSRWTSKVTSYKLTYMSVTLDRIHDAAVRSQTLAMELEDLAVEALLDGASQSEVAASLGVSQPAVSQMLHRRRNRTIGPYWTVPVLAGYLRDKKRESDNTIIRACAQFSADFRRLGDPTDRRVALGTPEPTGDRRIDCLIAGLADYEARRAGIETPAWATSERYDLFPSWFLAPTDGLKAWAMSQTPPEFECRGVFLDPRDLESV
ncbi:MAG: hypothetical protein JW722_09110 [Demequinaceae bacterium]|nr:hypothetical protein [Demequinaceae bacterium]